MIDFVSMSKEQAERAFVLIASLLSDVTIRTGLNGGVYDPVTETTTGATWDFAKPVKALAYDDSEEAGDGPEKRLQCFLVLASALEGIRGEQEAEIVTADGRIWKTDKAETDPAGAIWIFTCEK